LKVFGVREGLKNRDIHWQIAIARQTQGCSRGSAGRSLAAQTGIREGKYPLQGLASAPRSSIRSTSSRTLFHYKKVRYKGLAKNTAQLHTLFALANLMIAKRRLLALNGASCVLNRTKGTEMGREA